MDYKKISADELAQRAIEAYAAEERSHRVAIRLREPKHTPRWQVAMAATVAVVAVVVGVAWMSRPTVWGYVNGRPLYSLEEAQYYAEQALANLAVADLQPQEDILQKILSLD